MEFQFNQYIEKLAQTKSEKIGVGTLSVVMFNGYRKFDDVKDDKIIDHLKASYFSLNDSSGSRALKESNACADYSSYAHLRASNNKVKLTDKGVYREGIEQTEYLDDDDVVLVEAAAFSEEDGNMCLDEDLIIRPHIIISDDGENDAEHEKQLGEYFFYSYCVHNFKTIYRARNNFL